MQRIPLVWPVASAQLVGSHIKRGDFASFDLIDTDSLYTERRRVRAYSITWHSLGHEMLFSGVRPEFFSAYKAPILLDLCVAGSV